MTGDSVVPAGPAWKVITTVPATGPDKTGRNVPGLAVTAQLVANGATFQVFVPQADLDYPDRIRADIMTKAAALDAVVNMRHGL